MKILLMFFAFLNAHAADPGYVTIGAKNVIIYESPMTMSAVVRRAFPGEVLKVTEFIKTDQGDTWGKVFLSPAQSGYVQGMHLANSGNLQQSIWQPEEVLRSKMPFSFAAKGPAEFFGPALQFRYLPFTRLGLSAGAGSVIDQGKTAGFSVAYGLICILSMKNISPFVETGVSTLTFTDDHSTLKISSFYINAGVEWIFRNGYYLGAGVSYNRSYNAQLSYDYGYARSSGGAMKVGNYGSFTSVEGADSLQRLNPLLLVGYSF